LSGLPNGAKLSLVQGSKSPSVVTVALQLPASEQNARLIHKVSSTTSLWQILRQLESGAANATSSATTPNNLNFTQRAVAPAVGSGSGRLFYEMPVLTYTNRDLGTFVDLQKTLSQLGVFSGNVLLRLSYKPTETPLEDAMNEISKFFKDEPVVTPPSFARPSESTVAVPTVESNEPMDLAEDKSDKAAVPLPAAQSNGAAELEENQQAIEPSITVFQAPTGHVPSAVLQSYNDSDYEPTADHARIHQARLQDASRNRKLPSDSEIATKQAAQAEKLASVKTITVRIRLPDSMHIQTTFDRSSAAAAVYTMVRNALVDAIASRRFVLRYNGDNGRMVPLPDDGKVNLVNGLKWKGSVLVIMAWDVPPGASPTSVPGPLLKPEYLAQAKALAPAPAATEVGQKPDSSDKKGFLGGLVSKGKKSNEEKESKLRGLLGFGKKK
jgi:tether containing UBX domain for GLUT4